MYYKALMHIDNVSADDLSKCQCNLILCLIKIENYGEALEYANLCIEKNPKFIKGYYRKSQALISLGEFKDAKKLLTETQKFFGVKNQDFEEKIKSLNTLIKEREFF